VSSGTPRTGETRKKGGDLPSRLTGWVAEKMGKTERGGQGSTELGLLRSKMRKSALRCRRCLHWDAMRIWERNGDLRIQGRPVPAISSELSARESITLPPSSHPSGRMRKKLGITSATRLALFDREKKMLDEKEQMHASLSCKTP
jgi:hypothetical protein